MPHLCSHTNTQTNCPTRPNAKRHSSQCALWASESTLTKVSCQISYTILHPTCPTSPILGIGSSIVLATSPRAHPSPKSITQQQTLIRCLPTFRRGRTVPKHFFVNKFDYSHKLQYLCAPQPEGLPPSIHARMAESVDALVSNTSGAIRAGSIPAPGTRKRT